jgi:small-conductance mechanosensitive channel
MRPFLLLMSLLISFSSQALTLTETDLSEVDRLLDKSLILIQSGANQESLAENFMKVPNDTQKAKIAKVLLKLQLQAIVPINEGPISYFPIADQSVYMIKTKAAWKFTASVVDNIDQISEAAFRLDSPEKSLLNLYANTRSMDFVEALEGVVNGEKAYEAADDKAKQRIEKALENLTSHLSRKKLNEFPMTEQGGVLRSFTTPFGELNFVKNKGDWLITISTFNNLILDHYGRNSKDTLEELFPKQFQNKIFLVKNWQWVVIVSIIIIGFLLQLILTKLLKRTVIKKMSRQGAAVQNSKGTRSIAIMSMGFCWYFLIPYTGVESGLTHTLEKGCLIVALVASVLVISRVLDLVMNVFQDKAEHTETKLDDVLLPMLRKILKFGTIIVGFTVVASNLGIDVGTLIAGLGIGGLAFALAAKDTVENIFGSLTLLFDRPFEVGDWVVIDGVEGTVESIGLRSTRVRTFYCSEVSVPNANLIRANVDNYGRRTYRRIKTNLGMTYDSPPEKLEAFCEGIRELIRNHPHTRKDYYHVYLNNFDASSLNILLYCFLDVPDWAIELRERQRLFMDIIRLANRLELSFAFPTQTLHMAQKEDLHDTELNTSVESIGKHYNQARGLAKDVIRDSGSNQELAAAVNYSEGNSYVSSSKG